MGTKNRIYFGEGARSFVILLALLFHSLIGFSIWQNYNFESFAPIKMITSTVTPTFLFLFGMMLEIVHFKKLQKEEIKVLIPNLVKRSFQCYIGYLLTVAAGFMGGLSSLKLAFSAAIFFGNSHFGNILKLYTFMLLLAIPILMIRKKYGVWSIFILGLSYWVLYPLLPGLPNLHDNVSMFSSTLFGFGGKSGPSVLNGLSIVLTGMLSASFINYEHKYMFQKKSVLILCITLGLLGPVLLINFVSPEALLENYVTNTFRYLNHPYYYLIGISLAIFISLVFSFLIPLGSQIPLKYHSFLVFGRLSLETFAIGNVILNLFYHILHYYRWSLAGPFLSFVINMFYILLFYEKQIRAKNENIVRQLNEGLSNKIDQYITFPISRKIKLLLNRKDFTLKTA